MTLEQLISIRDEISALLLCKVDGSYSSERAAAQLAAKQLEQMGCMGGSTRAFVESEVVRLMRRFDDTQDSSFGPWPVDKFMTETRGVADTYRKALERCIAAHKTGKFEPMMAAIEAAEATLSSQKGNE